jgi:hypothetical protein
MAAVDALQHVNVAMVQPEFQIRGTRIALASCYA